MFLYEGLQDGERFVVQLKKVNLYNWQKHLEEIIQMIYVARIVAAQTNSKPQRTTDEETMLTGGEDGPAIDIEETTKILERIFAKTKKTEECETLKQKYLNLVKYTGTSSNKQLATATINFCIENIV